MPSRAEHFKKPFKAGDLVIYIGLPVVFALLIFLFIFLSPSASDTVCGDCGSSRLFSYNFVSDKLTLYDDEKVSASDHNGKITLTIIFGGEHNTLEIDKENKTVTMKDADCGNKSCMLMGPLKNGSGVIICSPHSLRIYYEDDDSLILG